MHHQKVNSSSGASVRATSSSSAPGVTVPPAGPPRTQVSVYEDHPSPEEMMSAAGNKSPRGDTSSKVSEQFLTIIE